MISMARARCGKSANEAPLLQRDDQSVHARLGLQGKSFLHLIEGRRDPRLLQARVDEDEHSFLGREHGNPRSLPCGKSRAVVQTENTVECPGDVLQLEAIPQKMRSCSSQKSSGSIGTAAPRGDAGALAGRRSAASMRRDRGHNGTPSGRTVVARIVLSQAVGVERRACAGLGSASRAAGQAGRAATVSRTRAYTRARRRPDCPAVRARAIGRAGRAWALPGRMAMFQNEEDDAARFERRSDEIMVANRGTADRDDHRRRSAVLHLQAFARVAARGRMDWASAPAASASKHTPGDLRK